MDQFELQKLRDLPIEGVAERLGLRVTRHMCLCPFHDDHHASLSFRPGRGTWRCFTCGAHGGTIDLVMRYLGKDFLDACRWLAGEFGLAGDGLAGDGLAVSGYRLADDGLADDGLAVSGERLAGEAAATFDARRYERFFQRPWLSEAARRFLFDERRLDERVVTWCRLTSWRDRQGTDWLQIPYFDRDGRLIGIQNRNLRPGGSPRFRFPAGAACSIYNLPVLDRLATGEALYITEGCSDCWAMLSAGHKAVAIPSATLLMPKDIALLRSLGDERATRFHMYPDRDEPGERLFLQLRDLLPNLEHHQLPPECKDFSEFYVKNSLIDN